MHGTPARVVPVTVTLGLLGLPVIRISPPPPPLALLNRGGTLNRFSQTSRSGKSPLIPTSMSSFATSTQPSNTAWLRPASR